MSLPENPFARIKRGAIDAFNAAYPEGIPLQGNDKPIVQTMDNLITDVNRLRDWQRRAVEVLVQYCRYGTDVDDAVTLIREAGEPLPEWLEPCE